MSTNKKPLITKEDFVKILNFIHDMSVKFINLTDCMEKLSEGFFVDFFPNLAYETKIVDLLNILVNEPYPKDSLIDYFLYELNFGSSENATQALSCGGTTFDLSTPELLYDAIVEMYFDHPEKYQTTNESNPKEGNK